MLWQQIKKYVFWISTNMGRRFFHPESNEGTRKLQVFWLSCGGLLIIAFAYAIFTFLFAKAPIAYIKENTQPIATPIETATKKVNINEAFRNRIEGSIKNLSDKITGLEKLVLEGIKKEDSFPENQNTHEENETPSLTHVSSQDHFHELEAKILSLEQQVETYRTNALPHYSNLHPEGQGEQNTLIQKVSLSLENPKLKKTKTVDTTIPAGAFAKTVLLSGLDASSAMTASSDPRPMLLRIIDPGTLPRRFQSDLKDCHCTAGAYGDLSSERVYARLEKLTCIERNTGEIIETQVAGYIAGSDGKAGLRGVVASKDGQFLLRSLMGGMFAGLSNVANPQNRQAMVSPFAPGSLPTSGALVSPPNVGEMFTSGMSSGATSALDRLSQYYIDRAEQLQPVIQVAAGQVVDIVFTEGVSVLQCCGVPEDRNQNLEKSEMKGVSNNESVQ